ncbi:LacI family DNA-binding transcriptional regulator [Azospirillum canadense]|uniref:LacI family DNA-binding transcriptional regulator n=1 Tax=Azospirillum canadense TaxID=403962 RepID=UPI002227F669|nr:LacI family DNA-binding transcriptional regulator [Azospirillum canadense]MCW2240585.1 LacI family transcriptional regulator [Azospirillum canadense]
MNDQHRRDNIPENEEMPDTVAHRAPSGRRVTLVDIAQDAKVSRATVSLVLRNSTQIPEATSERVRASMARLGYVYNRGAASLRTELSHTVGIVVPDITNPYFAEKVAAIETALRPLDRIPFLNNSREDAALQDRFLDTLREHNVEGILLCPSRDSTADSLQRVLKWRLPLIQFSRYVPGVEADYVGADNDRGVRHAVEHLIGLGHRRIAFIGANPDTSTGREREAGWRAALNAAGLTPDPDLVIACPATRDDGMNTVLRLLGRPNPPTAAMCFNDVLAIGVMLGLRYIDREPGRDFSVIGCDNIAETALWRPALTTIAIPYLDIGTTATNQLMRRIADPDRPAERIILDTGLVIRASTAPPPAPPKRKRT